MKEEINQDAKLSKKKPVYEPSVGKCPSDKFILTRTVCDYRKDRWECKNAQTLTDPYAVDKCVQCQNPPTGKNTFVYVGSRNNKDSNFSLNKKPYYFTALLRIGLVYEKAKITLTRTKTNQVIYPVFVNPQQVEFVIDKTTENEPMLLTVEYESYRPYDFSDTDKADVNDLVLNKTPREDAMKSVCETNENRVFTNNRNNDTVVYGCGTGICCERLPANMNRRYAIVGQFESVVNARRQMAFDVSIQTINGLAVEPSKGPPRFGSVKGSAQFKDRVNPGLMSKIAQNRFWVWDKNTATTSKCEFRFMMPVSFLESTFSVDANICPTGPVIATDEAAQRLETGACDRRINGERQGPGTYTKACLQQMFLEAGCEESGKGYPVTQGQMNTMMKKGNNPLSRDDITSNIEKVKSQADKPYRQGMDIKKLESDNMFCYGRFDFNPCNTPAKETGPHTPECLDFLFRNAGKKTEGVGPTYKQTANRTSGTNRTSATPVQFCQRTGTLAPIKPDGSYNETAVNKANTLGSVHNVQEFYDRVHRLANFSTVRDEQRRSVAECYGVAVPREKVKSCGGKVSGEVRYVKITHGMRNYLQISQVVILDANGKNIAMNKPVITSPSYPATRPSSLTDGILDLKPYPDCWISADGNGQILIDLKTDASVNAVVIYNRKDCCRDRSMGTIIELLSKTQKVLATKQMVGGDIEKVSFGPVSEDNPEQSILDDNAVISLIPASSPASKLMNLLGSVVVQADVRPNQLASTKFKVNEVNTDEVQLIAAGGTPVDGKVAVQGFSVVVQPDDGTEDFKRRSSWKVTDSVARNPGEISFESISNPGFYLFVNMLDRKLAINNNMSPKNLQAMSFVAS
jgi:hypothetical protein